MKRKDFLKTLALMPLISSQMKVNALNKLANSLSNTEKMPVLFLGHGSPMNAIEENEFVQGFRAIKEKIPTPQAILCISAHWETKGTYVTAMQHPKTIHDFGGFPKALFDVQYPAPGNPDLANEIKNNIKSVQIGLDDNWGLDHGAWSVIKHLYPKANIPVLEMSLDYYQSPQYHYDLAKELAWLREKGVLIIGSGNIVHNLRMVAWDKMNEVGYGFDWATETNEKVKQLVSNGNYKQLTNYRSLGSGFQMSIPTPEHYLPMIYAIALKNDKDEISFFNDKMIAGSLSMTSIIIG